MTNLDEVINTSQDVREVKRALSVKMLQNGITPGQIHSLLNVSVQYVSKWKTQYEAHGVSSLLIAYKGKESYLNFSQECSIVQWIQNQKTLTIEQLIEHIAHEYGITYKSKQSYYNLLDLGGMSFHRSEKVNPKHDTEKVLEKREEIKKKLLENAAAIESGEIVVLLQDECHLLWGDCCGRVWGKRNQTIEVPMNNARQRQTYYGAVNMLTKDIHLQACDKGNSENTIAYVRYLQETSAGKTIWLWWDNASYHRSAALRDFLAQENEDLSKDAWKIFCIPFEPNAPEQNPIEDIWLQGKNFLRKNFVSNKTFSNVKQCFVSFLTSLRFDSHKFNWYFLQMI